MSDVIALCLNSFPASKCFLLLPLAFNYEPDNFPLREINICLFIKDAIYGADTLVNVHCITSVPDSLFRYNIFLTEHSQ